ncbi:MAG: hypothetical protein P4L85_24760 [Paludisphaera borealis]|uniref:hypothetical protein n=1 Tax=Paludisphaera borealis TaxID=1387353 RepID=UPI00284FC604|nr:hypothetical protein [Paludisphaera borealis]MDR3622586.1 hypothetical protein [Paludisphaera borealis]
MQHEPAFRAAEGDSEHARASGSVQSTPTAAVQAVSKSQERSRRADATKGISPNESFSLFY